VPERSPAHENPAAFVHAIVATCAATVRDLAR